jgi:hypothetical protein
MKKVNFDLEVEVHDDLKDEVIKEYISRYFINKKSFDAFTLQVIGERDYPLNFQLGDIKFDLKKKKAKFKSKAKAKK